jgi:hypothetical protein
MTERQKRDSAAELGALGYPNYSYLKPPTKPKPAEVLLDGWVSRISIPEFSKDCDGWP